MSRISHLLPVPSRHTIPPVMEQEPFLDRSSSSLELPSEGIPFSKDEEIPQYQPKKPRFWSSKSPILRSIGYAIGWFLIGYFILWTVVKVLTVSNVLVVEINRPEPKDCYCGKSTIEAQAMGCIFDPLALSWLPPHCLDPELTEEFNHAGPGENGTWEYYADRNATIELDHVGVSLLADTSSPVFVSFRWHLVHCNYYWRRLYRKPITHSKLDPIRDSINHVKHCGTIPFTTPFDNLDVVGACSKIQFVDKVV